MSANESNAGQPKEIHDGDLSVEYVSIGDLVPYARNAKEHPSKQVDEIANSIKTFGMNDPVGVWTNPQGELEIVEGHGRVLALEKLGAELCPVIRLDSLTDEERRAYTHVHNQTTLTSGFDEELLFKDLDELDFEWADFGFDDDLGMDDETSTGDIIEDEEPEVAEPFVRAGDVWVCGNHRVMCGDSTKPEDIALLMGGLQADMIVTDPPYNVAYEGKTEDALTIENDSMSDADFRKFLTDAFSAADTALKAGGAIYICHSDSEGYNFRGACLDCGWGAVRETLIWAKNSMVMGRQDYQWKHEPILYLWKPGASHSWYSDRKQTTVLEFDRPNRNGEHPTMKPIALFAYLIKNSSKKGDVVLDSFGGSGTSVIACEQVGRRCCTMELDERYASVIVRRYIEFSGEDGVYLEAEDGQKPYADVLAERGL